MSNRRRIFWMVVVVAIPFAGKWARQDDAPRCIVSGLRIDESYRVRIVRPDGAAYHFCCPKCAATWRTQQRMAVTVFVRDEVSGTELSANAAIFVRSRVATNVVTGNRIRVFSTRRDADEHVRVFGGYVLDKGEAPFEE